MTTMATHVRYTLPIASIESLEEQAWEFDCLCISHEPPDPNAWPAELSDLPSEGLSIVRVSFTKNEPAEHFCAHILRTLGLEGALEQEEVDDWLEYHRPFTQPIILKTLSIQPIEPPCLTQQDPYTIYLPPGLGFGTGRHETTRACLLLLESLQDYKPSSVIDFGCGSGILAIAALRLGAENVQFHDHDPQALRATRENLKAHGYEKKGAECAQLTDLVPADCLMANIVWEPLNILCENFVNLMKPGAFGIFSGLSTEQEQIFIDRYSPFLTYRETLTEGAWVGILMQKPASL